MRRLSLFCLIAGAFFLPPALATGSEVVNKAEPARAAPADDARLRQIERQLHPVSGDVVVSGANAVLHLGHDFYFLPADEARLVLTEGWGNPPEEADGLLGMVFPAGASFRDDIWGASIRYYADGYVSDSDAASLDLDRMLEALRGDEAALNAERNARGFPATHLVGWAQRPVYDRQRQSVIFARNAHFDGDEENTLHYSIRLLGRRGTLAIDFVGLMSELDETRTAAQRLLAAAEFVPGERYADFRPGRDAIATYGIAGLIAPGVDEMRLPEWKGAGALILLVMLALGGIILSWLKIRSVRRSRSEAPITAYTEMPRPPSASG